MKVDWRKKEKSLPHGIVTVRVKTFAEFIDYIDYVHRTTGVNRQYIWRGQRCSDWKLQTTLDRKLFKPYGRSIKDEKFIAEYLKNQIKVNDRLFNLIRYEVTNNKFNHFNGFKLQEYLADFKLAVRGRRGPNPPSITNDNDWWALGQHHGLSTPLLDWTGSPFVACFFGFEDDKESESGERAVYGLWEDEVKTINEEILQTTKKAKVFNHVRHPIIEFVRPYSDENPRLVGQKGLFTRSPLGIDMEEWIRINCNADYETHILIKILIPNSVRQEILRSLNRMNINYLSLFPDLIGASKYCNMTLDDNGYKGG